MWESRCFREIPKTLWERWDPAFGFPRFPHRRHFHSSPEFANLTFTPSFGFRCPPGAFPTRLASGFSMSSYPALPDHIS